MLRIEALESRDSGVAFDLQAERVQPSDKPLVKPLALKERSSKYTSQRIPPGTRNHRVNSEVSRSGWARDCGETRQRCIRRCRRRLQGIATRTQVSWHVHISGSLVGVGEWYRRREREWIENARRRAILVWASRCLLSGRVCSQRLVLK